MKIVYIAHPISGDIEGNLADILRIVRKINLEQPDIVPCVPYYTDVLSMDDKLVMQRKRGIDNNTTLLMSGLYEEMWLTGNTISFGMREEIALAVKLGMEVIDLTNIF